MIQMVMRVADLILLLVRKGNKVKQMVVVHAF